METPAVHIHVGTRSLVFSPKAGDMLGAWAARGRAGVAAPRYLCRAVTVAFACWARLLLSCSWKREPRWD
jgi:hypothetical protein